MNPTIKAALTTACLLGVSARSRAGLVTVLGVTLDAEAAVLTLSRARFLRRAPTEAELREAQRTPPRFCAPACGRCGGSGYIHAFRHVDGGRCFECDGHGIHLERAA